jgi:hypothetical protein
MGQQSRHLQDRIARKRGQHDVKMAEEDAEAAEEDAADALYYAAWAVDQAKLAVLDAMTPAPEPTRGRQRRHRAEQSAEEGRSWPCRWRGQAGEAGEATAAAQGRCPSTVTGYDQPN